jgi:ElaB/YqjD/DUF883 family membrane-anchored ribosome-binding protein
MLESNIKTARNDMKTLVEDAQQFFREATSASGATAEELRNKGLSLLDAALEKAQGVQSAAMETGKEIAESADDYVQQNPWRAIALSAGVGLLIGLMLARK